MKRISANKLLGIAMGPRGLLIAELARSDGGHKVLRTAAWDYPEGLCLDKPQELGVSLARQLRSQGFTARDVVIGLPAMWLVTRRRDLPAVAPEAAAGVLRLFAETEFATDLKDLVIDYAGQANPASPSSALLVGTSRTYVEQCQAMANAAKFRLRAITVTGGALAWLSHRDTSAKGIVLSLTPIGAELVVQQDGVPSQLRHLALVNGEVQQNAPVINELRRTIATLPGGQEDRALSIWADQPANLEVAVKEKLNVVVRAGRLQSVTADGNQDRFAPAVAVALAAIQGHTGAIDFLHTRLAPPKPKSNRRPLLWAAAVGGTIIFATAYAFYDLSQREQAITEHQAALDKSAPVVRKDEVALKRLETARSWTSGKPRFLACMADLTALFPDEGSIWATTWSLKADMSGLVSGKAAGEQQVLALLDRFMKDNKHFANPALIDMRDSGKTGHEIAFSISFTYRPAE